MGNQVSRDSAYAMNTRNMNGRRVIYTSAEEITAENVREVVEKAMDMHELNRREADYLYRYYKGEQPILWRTKTVRPEICNKIVMNHANEIVSFKVGYLCGEPVQYVNRSGEEDKSEEINKLNDAMIDASKIDKDQEIVEWQMITGTAYRMVLQGDDDSPFEIYTLDPRNTFVVYIDKVGNRPMLGVYYTKDDDGNVTFSCYTETEFFEWTDNVKDIDSERHALGMIPIIEYPANNARLGAFEPVLGLLDALNNVESNRVDGLEQFVQAFMKFINCDIDEATFERFKEQGLIKIKSHDGQKADVELVTSELDQSQSQTLKNDIYTAILTICSMPNRSQSAGRYSSSDTGIAVELRDGWSAAETSAKASENIFKRSERQMLRLVCKLGRELGGIELAANEIDIKFTRRNFEGIQAKSQVLTTMLDKPQIHPLLAFTACGLFTDPETAYQMSKAYYEGYKEEQFEKLRRENEINAETEAAGSGGTSSLPSASDSSTEDVGSVHVDAEKTTNKQNREVSSYMRNGHRVKAYTR